MTCWVRRSTRLQNTTMSRVIRKINREHFVVLIELLNKISKPFKLAKF